MQILKEDVSKYLEGIENSIVYISSSLKNLDYYNNKILDSGLFYTNNMEYKEFLDMNIRLVNKLNEKGKKIIFIDFSLALRMFFEKFESIKFEISKQYNLDDIENKLIEFGYEKSYLVEAQGQYSRRNDIIDIFSCSNDYPIRLDFFDIELEKIKLFDLDSQKSFETIKDILIYSNISKSENKILSELLNDNIEIIIENKELIEFNLARILDSENNSDELRIRYEKLIQKSNQIEVVLSDKRNYSSEIQIEKEKISRKKIRFKDISHIKKGDYAIHVQYGIGIYQGLSLINGKECIELKYADEDKLYIPIENLNRLEKYISFNEKEPEIYKLGRRGFSKKRQKYQEEIEKTARELIKIQAKRQSRVGIAFNEDSIWQKEFEEKFEHLETKDQLLAIEEVKKDMQSSKIMDRIVCGDVGYGKTEVAMRAAFKAVESGYQVAILAPTTVLATQHYERFKKRFDSFPITIEPYSRLYSNNVKLKKLSEGKIDILIGTHKILSDNVMFNKLGLLIVDEEQKFGVSAKEKLKNRKSNIDVLTLTATPIPRTLNLALLGIRDLSIISTPPVNKLTIDTQIIENISDDELRKIILNEISRDGQVFYISNDVKSMEFTVKKLKSLLPDFINVQYINGQIPITEIKQKLSDFDDNKIQVLVASTIVENGIDVENANTIIIEDYTRLGLSQIYQLRGRVGRGKRRGYCYLLRSDYITKKGSEKQQTIDKIKELVFGGFTLSMEDMKIRGAGEILGNKQHGAIESFGYDLYIKMLNEEIKRQKGEFKDSSNIKLDIEDMGYIPNDYIKESERILIYKRISEIESSEQLEKISEELIDRFGKMPQELKKLLFNIKIKIYAYENGFDSVSQKNDEYIFYSEKHKNMVKLSRKQILEV